MIYQICKTEADTKKPSAIIEKHLITLNYNFKEETRTDSFDKKTRSVYVCDTILVRGGKPTYDTLASFLIQLKYSTDEQTAIIRKKIADIDTSNEFADFNAYAEECKALAKTLMENYNAFC